MVQWYRAREQFSIDLDGATRTIGLGEVLSEKDPVVKHCTNPANGESKFEPLDTGAPEAPKATAVKPRGSAKGGG